MMEWIILESLTDEKATYRYYPEDSKEYGIVSLMRKTGKRIHDKPHPDVISEYARQAWRRLEEYQKNGHFPERGQIAWY